MSLCILCLRLLFCDSPAKRPPLANSIFELYGDSNGVVIEVFHSACNDLGEIASAVETGPEALIGRAFQTLNENEYGQYDDLIVMLVPALGLIGLEHLKQRMTGLSKELVQKCLLWSVLRSN